MKNRKPHPDLHAGTLRWYVEGREAPTPRVLQYLTDEQEHGLCGFAYYADFGRRVDQEKAALGALLRRLRESGAEIGAYGAAAKGATLVNSTGPDNSLVSFVVDRNTHKQASRMPGARLPILDPSALLERQPDYLLLLARNFKDEIMQQQEESHRRGGRFTIPLPSPRIL